ncbi:Hypothetical protein D9617_14g075570 [Elsinoe fawcettii]|nr:Hypothetical protein D9617_14g075570 [Elsinoe fawcettii]
MEYKFVASDAKDLKRKRPHGACESCKKRKKRCYHGEDGNSEDVSRLSSIDGSRPEIPLFSPPAPIQKPSGPRSVGPSPGQVSGTSKTSPASHRPPSIPSRSSRFVGDTHAEANLELEQDDPSERRDRDGVGIWMDSADEEAAESDQSHTEAAESNVAKGPLIRDEDKRALLSVFIARVQPLFPLLEAAHTDLDSAMKMNETLSLAVCLVAAKDERSRSYLRFSTNPSALPVNMFTKKLHRIIEARVRNWRSFDRLDLIRILTLISTHQEGPEGPEEASMHLSEAIHHAYTWGIHLNRHAEARIAEDNARLFWCIWSWDKLSAAANGRPRMSYEMDVGLDYNECLKLFETPGKLWLKIARLLSSVNDLYNPRPCVDTESHIKDFPRWEFLLEEEEDVKGMDEGFLTTLELFYHSVSMLSCRIKFLVGRKRAFASSLRRYLSAATVYSISKCVPAQDLAPLPVVPYAYCLATLVAYQQYRCSQRQVHRDIAEEKLAHFQEQLQAMSSCWYAAKSMARKSQRVLREFRRCNAIGDKQQNGHNSSGSTASSHPATVSSTQIPTPDSFVASKDMPAGQMMYNTNGSGFNDVSNMGYGAFADMDMMFGNLMDMNAFTGDIEFALAPHLDTGYNASSGMWPAGEGINGGT